ncbi:hypothetical protein DFH27DRAFT_309298 [Peziza echinospora]|nr:hypothetical protein DFH27DRAFT_309298 [Peziza echinospora]
MGIVACSAGIQLGGTCVATETNSSFTDLGSCPVAFPPLVDYFFLSRLFLTRWDGRSSPPSGCVGLFKAHADFVQRSYWCPLPRDTSIHFVLDGSRDVVIWRRHVCSIGVPEQTTASPLNTIADSNLASLLYCFGLYIHSLFVEILSLSSFWFFFPSRGRGFNVVGVCWLRFERVSWMCTC